MGSDLTEYETNLAFLCRDILGIGARQKRLRETHSVLFAGTLLRATKHTSGSLYMTYVNFWPHVTFKWW
jgi:hypothetical protein